jgi:hypothetical protein
MEVMVMIGKLLKLVFLVIIALSASLVNAQTRDQKSRNQMANAFSEPATVQQPLFTEYKGVRIGMTAQEVRAKLGMTGMRVDDQEFYVFNDRETAQFGYDSQNRVEVISVDYLGGTGAPDYRSVVGPDITVKPDGSMYKMVRYDQLGFWVSYNRTANNSVVMVSITIQKML